MNRHIITAMLLLVFAATAIAGEVENVTIVKSMIEAIDNRNLDALDDLVTADVVRHSAATPGVSVSNIAEFKEFLKADFAVCPDSKQEIEIIFGSGNMVAVRARYSGTQTGAMGPFPASGKRMEIPFMGIIRIENGKIAELWVEWDNLGALSQLGHFPPKAEEASDK